jgi:AraC-like DNA-binding protein
MHKPENLHNHIYLWPGRFLMATPRIRNLPHRHLAASVLIGVEGPFVLGIKGCEEKRVDAALVQSDVEQHLNSLGAPMVILHVDPDQSWYRSLSPHLRDRAVYEMPAQMFDDLRSTMRDALARPLGCVQARQLFTDLVNRIRGDAPEAKPLDGRIARIVRYLRRELPEKLDPDALAAEAGISRSRLMHLFKAELGTSMRRFAISLRLQVAMTSWKQGVSLTTVAHHAGFYDLSHLLQAGRAYSGETASTLQSMFSTGDSLRVYACRDSEDAPQP